MVERRSYRCNTPEWTSFLLRSTYDDRASGIDEETLEGCFAGGVTASFSETMQEEDSGGVLLVGASGVERLADTVEGAQAAEAVVVEVRTRQAEIPRQSQFRRQVVRVPVVGRHRAQ